MDANLRTALRARATTGAVSVPSVMPVTKTAAATTSVVRGGDVRTPTSTGTDRNSTTSQVSPGNVIHSRKSNVKWLD